MASQEDSEHKSDVNFPAKNVNTNFPQFIFPVCHVGEDSLESSGRDKTKWGFFQRINQIEYGSLSACIPTNNHKEEFIFRNNGRHRIVHYITGPLPLLPPNQTTPFDYLLTSNSISQTKQYLCNQFRYFRLTFPHTYIPVSLNIEHLQESLLLDSAMKELEPNQSSVVEYVSCHSYKVSDNSVTIQGYLLFASGPNLNEITITILTDNITSSTEAPPTNNEATPTNYSSYYDYINSQGCVKLSCAQTLKFPGRIKEIKAISVNNEIGARTDYYVIFLEGPSKSTEKLLRKKWKDTSLMSSSPVELLKPIHIYQTSVLTSCLTLCPYYYGEALFMTEAGGLYLWNINEGVTEVQAPILDETDASQVSHMWRCVWGPHPRSAVVSETSCASLIEFRNEELTYTLLFEYGSKYLASHWIISSLARHPINPFLLFISTTDKVLLFDLRQHNEPLLEIRHEIPQTIRYMDVVCLPWQPEETTLMMSSLHGPDSQVINIKGGFSYDNSKEVMAPYVCIGLHSVDTNRAFQNELNISSPHLQHHVVQDLAGSCLIPLLTSQTLCGIFVTFLGDLFHQCWRYGPHPPLIDPVVPYIPLECSLWVEEVIKMEQEIENIYNSVSSKTDVFKDFTLLHKYILSDLSDSGICMKCVELVQTDYVPSEPLVEFPQAPPTDGINVYWRCGLCLDVVYTQRHHFSANLKLHTLEDGMTGLEYLKLIEKEKRKLNDVSEDADCPSRFEELQQLWNEWDLNDKFFTGEDKEEEVEKVEENLSQQELFSQDTTISSQSCTPQKKKQRLGF